MRIFIVNLLLELKHSFFLSCITPIRLSVLLLLMEPIGVDRYLPQRFALLIDYCATYPPSDINVSAYERR